MKIALIDPSLFTWPYDKALAEGLVATGHQVTLYTKHLADGEQGKGSPLIREIFYPGLQSGFAKSLPQKVFLALKGLSHIVSLMMLWLTLRQDRPDVIHFQWMPLPVVDGLYIAMFERLAPVVLTVHDSSPFNNNPKSRLQGMGAVAVMKRFDRLIVHTEKAKAVLIGYGIAAGRVTRIAHGVLGGDAPKVQPPAAPGGDAPVIILLFGHLKPYKGADILIEALARMSAETRSLCRVRIVGKPQMDTGPLVRRAGELGVDTMIDWDMRFVPDEEVERIFNATDITVMPYREIDASGVLMVSLSLGRPIVASRIGLFAELLEDGRHGYLVPLEDPAALARALETLVQDPALRVRMGEEVRLLAQSVPTWREIAGATEHLYRDMKAAA